MLATPPIAGRILEYIRSSEPSELVTIHLHLRHTKMDFQPLDNPILSRILSSNAQWAMDVEQDEPGFFAKCAEGQSPKVGAVVPHPCFVSQHTQRSFG